jgi:hypothetical protein
MMSRFYSIGIKEPIGKYLCVASPSFRCYRSVESMGYASGCVRSFKGNVISLLDKAAW